MRKQATYNAFMPNDRDVLRHLVDELSEDEVRDVLMLVQQRTRRPATGRPAWIGTLHEGPDFAAKAKQTLRTELGEAR
jgi:hypothetical protein